MSSNSRVSVLINNYNYAQFLEKAIDSVLNQTYSNHVEVIVVDDGSTDNSRQIIEKYKDRITAIYKPNGGQASAFNTGFDNSQGDIICFLDADDVFVPEKLDKVVNAFENNPNIGWCFHPLKLVNANDEVINLQVYPDKSGVYDATLHMKRGKLRGKLPLDSIVTSGMCLNRPLLEKILPMPEAIKITSDDYIKYAALGMTQGFILLEELAHQRIHGNNAYTHTKRADKRQVASEVAILTAYNLKANYPFLSTFVDKIFAYGVATYAGVGDSHGDFQKIIDEYISSLAIIEKIKVMIRAKVYSLLF